ncbi:MAG: EamA family transporter [Armatimonadota bacterium]|nr:EamA family transporter [Armatimonadota bacterium]MDR7421299.1 EamA family transporter [Armatimonadota bacterium]MDR7455151.1 EamA family transporter [Armatimonadota bacterium]MDR7455778.1 EamA family transporter [Armatimonadota bacterium]MDR7496438.1 EamA family transporter [Armatimonadota bacterium]
MDRRPASGSARGYAQVAAAAICWGTLGLAARPLFAAGLAPREAAAWRAIGACVLLAVYCLAADRAALRLRVRDLPLLGAFGLVSVAGFMTVYFTAISLTTVATAAVLLYTAPAWVVVLARLLFGEPVTPMKGAAVGCAFAGCVLVVGAVGPEAVRLSPAGLLAGLGAGLTYALYSIFGKTALRTLAPTTTVVYTLTFGALALLAAGRGLPPVPPAAAVLPLAYVIVFPTALAYLLYISGLRRVEAGRASVVATLEPMVAALGGAFVLREPFGALQWIGAALVLTGVVLVQAEHLARRAAGAPRAAGATGPAGRGRA